MRSARSNYKSAIDAALADVPVIPVKQRELDLAVADLIEASTRLARLVPNLTAVQLLTVAHACASLQTMSRAVGNQRYLAALIQERTK